MRTNEPPSRAVLMANQTHWSGTKHIARFSMTRSSPEATGRCYWATTCSVLPGGRQGNNQQNNNAKCTHFAVHFDSHHDVATQYCTHCLMEEVRGFHKHKATKHHHRASTCSDITNQTHQHRLFLLLHHEKGLDLKCWPLITIGV